MAEPVAVTTLSPVERALSDARDIIKKIKTAMVRVYKVLVKETVQNGFKQIPEFIRNIIQKGVEVMVSAIETIIKGMQTVKEKGAAVIELLKELPNMMDATGDLVEAAAKRAAELGARIASFVVVFVEEAYDDVAKMLKLFAEIAKSIIGNVTAGYDPERELGVTLP